MTSGTMTIVTTTAAIKFESLQFRNCGDNLTGVKQGYAPYANVHSTTFTPGEIRGQNRVVDENDHRPKQGKRTERTSRRRKEHLFGL